MNLEDALQQLLAAELAKLTAAPEAEPVAAKAFDAEAFAASLSEKLGEIVTTAVDAKVEAIKTATAEPRGLVAKSLDNDPASFIAQKSAAGEALSDEEKRIAWEMTKAVLADGLRA
jgi:hypothetical protein